MDAKYKSRWMNKKGVLGMETAGAVFRFALILSVLAIAIFLSLDALDDEDVVPRKRACPHNSFCFSFTNETMTLALLANDTATTANLTDVELDTQTSVLIITNSTNQTQPQLSTDNFTVGSGDITGTSASEYVGTFVNVSGRYRYTVESDALEVTKNTSGGITTFFESIGTVFSILIAVVIILAVVLILLAIRRFSGGASIGGGSGGGLRAAESTEL